MALFDFMRRKPTEAKESQGYRLHMVNPGQPVWSPRDYASFADEAYTRNVIAYQAINRIADAVSTIDWLAVRGEDELTTHPILDLLERPNPSQGKGEFFRSHVGYLQISGNGYMERVLVGNVPKELWTLRPDRMKVLPSETGIASGYVYKVGSREMRWDNDPYTGQGDIRHFRLFHPLNDWYGLSPSEAGAYSVDQHNEASAWMQALLQNAARPSGALVMPGDKNMTDEQFNRLKVELEQNHQGAKNAGRPMLLEGGLDWVAMGLSPSDMGIIEAKLAAARDVALAFGVPPMLLGIPGDNTYSNYKEARLAFWEDTVIPMVDYLTSELNAWLSPSFGGVRLKPDYDAVEAIAEKRREMWSMADASAELTVNEVRAIKGYEPLPEPLGSTLMVQLRASSQPEPAQDQKAMLGRLAYGKA